MTTISTTSQGLKNKSSNGQLPEWVATQQKAFQRWANTYYESHDVPPLVDLKEDLADGVRLIQLLEIIGNEPLGRYYKSPKLRVQKAENVNTALDFIKHRGILLYNIGAEDIIDGNLKLILGLLWILVLRFTISEINEEGLSAKEGLLLWCQRKTAGYKGVEIKDFSSSWADGKAFCALIDRHRPDLLDYEEIDTKDHKGNTALAFRIAAEEVGIPQLLDVEDVCDVAKPDERSVMTYVAYWFHAFSALDKIETAGRRLEKFVEVTGSAISMQHGFERRMRSLLDAIRKIQQEWEEAKFEGTYADAKEQSKKFFTYKNSTKREWVTEKSELASLLGNIRTKLATYGLAEYDPPEGLKLSDLETAWNGLVKSEATRSRRINNNMRDIKEQLRKSFADTANEFALSLNTASVQISELDGELEKQLEGITMVSEQLKPLDDMLKELKKLNDKCVEANVEENDHTVYSCDELEYELGLAKQSVVKKLAFIENQIVARSMTNLTPIQLEEFESVFRYFDKGQRNQLCESEFSGALASLGLVYSEEEMHEVFEAACGNNGAVSFEQFINFMVEVTEDQQTAEQVFQSFIDIANGKDYVTELDLQNSLVPDSMIDQLKETMPTSTNGEGMDYVSYMAQLTGINGAK
jgi:Ca2+-binding EF-hand superfamily protein